MAARQQSDWLTHLWQDVLDVPGVMPKDGATVLVIGEGLPVRFAKANAIAVVRKAWGEKLDDACGFDRAIVLVPGQVFADFHLLFEQLQRVVRPDGQLVLVAARPLPWGVRGTPWHGGYPYRAWQNALRSSGWLVAEWASVGFSSAWWRQWWPEGGAVRVIVAQKRIGGLQAPSRRPEVMMPMKPAGVATFGR